MDIDWPVIPIEAVFSGTLYRPSPENSLEKLVSEVMKVAETPSEFNFEIRTPEEVVAVVPSIVSAVDDSKSVKRKKPRSRKIVQTSNANDAAEQCAGAKVLTFDRAVMDVRKFTIAESKGDEKEEAKVQLALKLGAKKKKNKNLPYDQLKEERRREKETAKQQRLQRKFDHLKKTKSGKIAKKLKKRVSKQANKNKS